MTAQTTKESSIRNNKIKPAEIKSTLSTWTQVDEALSEVAGRMAQIKKLEGKMNEELLKAQNKYQPALDTLNSEVTSFGQNIELFCSAHKDEFMPVRTKELNFGKVGFRTSPPALKTLKGFTWASVLSLLKAGGKKFSEYVKIKEDVNKAALLSANMKADQLTKIGCIIEQGETFFIEPDVKESV